MPILAILEAIKLWTGWSKILSALRWLFAHPMAALALALAVWGLIEQRAAAKWERSYHELVASTKAASLKAAAAQIAVNHQPAAISAAIAEKSNAEAPAYYRSAAAAADLHRLRGACPGGPGGAGVPGADHAPAIDDRPAAPADVVSRPKADDDLLVAAAARAAQMHADAEALIKAGVARASDQP